MRNHLKNTPIDILRKEWNDIVEKCPKSEQQPDKANMEIISKMANQDALLKDMELDKEHSEKPSKDPDFYKPL